MKLDIQHEPLALILQISPSGVLVEPVLRCNMQLDGASHLRDVWLMDMPADWLQKANELIKGAVKVLDE